MNGVRLLGELAYQYSLMTGGVVGENRGHWNIDEAMSDFKALMLECCDTCHNDYEVLIPKFRELVERKQYKEAKLIGIEIQSLMVKAIQQKFPNL